MMISNVFLCHLEHIKLVLPSLSLTLTFNRAPNPSAIFELSSEFDLLLFLSCDFPQAELLLSQSWFDPRLIHNDKPGSGGSDR